MLKSLIEAAIFTADAPLSVKQIKLLITNQRLSNKQVLALIKELQVDYQERGVELVQVASGFRFQAKLEFSELISTATQEKAPKYSRAILETLSLIAYRQPITRAEIEDVRGVAVSSHIIKTLTERQWIKTVGHKEVPGKPVLYGTTNMFLDYFNLTTLAQLPELLPISETSINLEDSQLIETATSEQPN